jgi:RNA polymerase sigma-70 factor (ECF subfamily)
VTRSQAGDVSTSVDALAEPWPRGVQTARTFADVARDHLADVYRYLLFLTADRHLAEDLTGETFERALRKWKRFDPRRGSERTWLCQVARSRALDHFRSEARRRKREENTVGIAETDPGEELFGEGISPELESALRTLSAGEREVVVLRIVLDLDAEAAARVLGISRSAGSMRLARALEKLEERMVCHAVA